MFDTKIALVLRDDLATWQKLNVTAFLAGGIVGSHEGLIGEDYVDAAGNRYAPLIVQPIIVLSATAEAIERIHRRLIDRGVRAAIYIEDMFATGHDVANRQAVRECDPADMRIVGLGIREARKIVDKITKGTVMHP